MALRLIIRWWVVMARGKIGGRCADIIDPVGGGDMLKRDPQFRQTPAQGVQHGVDENGFAVKDIDLGIRDLAVNAQRHADRGHSF
jgi:hypothetical protein